MDETKFTRVWLASSITCILFFDCHPTRLPRALLFRYSNGMTNLLKSCEGFVKSKMLTHFPKIQKYV